MTYIVPAVLGGIALTVMALVSLAAARKSKRQAAALLSAGNQPHILVHSINIDRCTGCDACVAVCPTNVLDLINNKSHVVRFQDCIQCEACMWACPTEALVMHKEGTEPPPLKVPELDEAFQTAVPGQYLIGEVAGKPLVKNAANLGRMVVEHMLATGLHPGAIQSRGQNAFDVVIVGSGPGGLSAALTCIQRKLSYVVLEKEQLVASTIARYPKGKLVMAEPYDVRNMSLLPVFDSSKEQLIPIWEDLMARTNVNIRRGEAVEEVQRGADGVFSIRTTVASYLGQRVVLATGTRGKPRTLGVPGENLPKVFFLLEDPADFRGQPVIVTGGGDSAVEAAIALADAGAKVVLSYRGRSFNRCAPKNKQAVESYAAQHRIKVRYQSNIVELTQDTVTLEMANGQRKTYPNQAAFVLIGSDPPIKWLEKLGVRFVERPHGYSLGKTDDLVMRFVPNAVLCPEDAVSAASLVLYGKLPDNQPALPMQPTQIQQPQVQHLIPPPPEQTHEDGEMSGARKWLRSATSMFTLSKKIDQPIPLSEFAKRNASQRHAGAESRRDALPPAERTRILRMLRDEGGRLADEDSRVDIQPVPAGQFHYDDEDDDDVVSLGPELVEESPQQWSGGGYGQGGGYGRSGGYGQGRGYDQGGGYGQSRGGAQYGDEELAKPAVVVGLARAQAQQAQSQSAGSGSRRPPPQAPQSSFAHDEATVQMDSDESMGRLLGGSAHESLEHTFEDEEATRAIVVDTPVRRAAAGRGTSPPPAGRSSVPLPASGRGAPLPPPGGRGPAQPHPMSRGSVPPQPAGGYSAAHGQRPPSMLDPNAFSFDDDDATQAVDVSQLTARRDSPQQRPAAGYSRSRDSGGFDDEATQAVDLDSMRGNPQAPRSLTDVDWDLD